MSVYVTNIGFTRVGDHWGKSIGELAFEASKKILKESPIRPDALIVANALSELSSSQGQLAPIIANSLELDGVESLKVEAAGASGAAALHVAISLIKSKQCKSALVVGVEKMRDIEPTKVTLMQNISENAEYSQFFGISFASINALVARMYMKEYNVTRENLSSFPVLAHKNSSTAEHAQFKKKFTLDEVSRCEVVSDPLRVLDCAPVGDGAAAALLVDEGELTLEQKRNGIEVLASESSTGETDFFERTDAKFTSSHLAAKKALHTARNTLDQINFFELHDAYSIQTALAVEAIGLSKQGEACIDAASGKFDPRGKHPISTFGGNKARGYPVGAAGVYQLCESYLQLTQRAGFNQVPNATRGLIHAMSGLDGSAYVHIVGRGGSV